MDYVTEEGVKLRTGYHDKTDWYLLVLKEKLDNAIDFMWKNYPGEKEMREVDVRLEIDKNDNLFVCSVSNTNDDNIPAFQNLDKILSFDMRYGSKQNERIISRGMLGDAMKQIATFPYVLMHVGDDGTAFRSKQWSTPMTINANGLYKEITIEVDKANQIIKPNIEITTAETEKTHTEITSTLPIIDEVSDDLDITKVEKYCRQYAVFTTDVSFNIHLTDNNTQNVKIDVPALHSVTRKWNNTSSVHTYTPQEFLTKIQGIDDKENTTVYDVLRTFKEGTQMKKTPELAEVSIAELVRDPNREDKIESWYHKLKSKLVPAEKLALPYSHISAEARRQALARRMNEVYGSLVEVSGDYLDTTKAAYKVLYGQVQDEDKEVTYPFAFEIIAVPINEDLVRADKRGGYESEFIGGAVNYSISPRQNKFDGRYEWTEVKKSRGQRYTYGYSASDIVELLSQRGGFCFHDYHNKTKSKRPCKIAANLISPKVIYQGHDKSRIDASPFTAVISEAVNKLAKDIETFGDIGIQFIEYAGRRSSSLNETRVKPTRVSRDTQITVADIIEELLREDIRRVKAGEAPTREATQDSLWYNALPLFEKYKDYMIWKRGNATPNRSAFKNQISTMCEKYGVTREQVGIRAAPWGSMYFEGKWHDISYDSIKTLAKKGTDIIFIEKRDIVQTLGGYADTYGVALVNTHGTISEYTKDLAEFADDSGANVAIFTDYDIPGLVIASKLPNVLWFGVNEPMLRAFGITHDDKNRVVPYKPGKTRMTKENLEEMLENDERFYHYDNDDVLIDIDFLRNHKVEIDAVLAHVGAAKLWDYIMGILREEYPTRNYLRVIEPTPSEPVEDYYPEPIKVLLAHCKRIAIEAIEKESEKIESELEEVGGFIEVEEKREEINRRLGQIIEENPALKEIAAKIGDDYGWW